MKFPLDRSLTTMSLSRYGYAPAKNGAEFYARKQLSPQLDTPVHVVLNATADFAQ